MIRIALAIAAFAAPAPSLAQATVGVTHHEAAGAIAGRSPHRAYRQVAATGSGCRTAAIHVPAGKLPHYGPHAMRGSTCANAAGLAAADTDRAIRRD